MRCILVRQRKYRYNTPPRTRHSDKAEVKCQLILYIMDSIVPIRIQPIPVNLA